MSGRPIALSIAGSDSSGGAGIQADLKTFSALGVYGATVLTAITAQNTLGVQGVHYVPAEFVEQQMASVFDDLDIGAVKTGMLGSRQIIKLVAKRLARSGIPSVVDPVMVATSGDLLIQADAIEVLRMELMPAATLVTPNLDEAANLLGAARAETLDELADQGRALHAMGAPAVLMKGGHLSGKRADDVLVTSTGTTIIKGERISTRNTHGTGCTLSSAIAAHLASGFPLLPAVQAAKAYLGASLAQADELDVGSENGPVEHLHAIPHPAAK